MAQKVAYVTGGMGGIGTAICQRLHREGFKVIAGCGPTRDYGKWLAEQKELGYTFHASVGNVGDWDSTVQAFGKARNGLAPESLKTLQNTARERRNVFEQLMEAVKYNSLGQISHALYDVGGEYRRNM